MNAPSQEEVSNADSRNNHDNSTNHILENLAHNKYQVTLDISQINDILGNEDYLKTMLVSVIIKNILFNYLKKLY